MADESVRRVVIGAEERTGWSSERPEKDGRPKVHGQARVLHAATELHYAPRSILLISGAELEVRRHLLQRLFPAELVISAERIEALVKGKVSEERLPATVSHLMRQAAANRLAAGRPTVVATETLTEAERKNFTTLAEESKRGAHLIILDAGRQAVADEDAFSALQALRALARDGEVGVEGFRTVLVLGRADVDALRSITFEDRRRPQGR